jgi:hypothetical protein
MNAWTLLPAIFLGLVFGTLVVRTGSVIPAMLGHMSNNATALVVANLLQDAAPIPNLLLAVLGALFVACATVFWRFTRGRTVDPSPLAVVPAGFSRRAAFWFKAAAVVAILFVAAIAAGIAFVIELATVPSGDLAPHLHKGDRVMVARDYSSNPSVRAGDIICYQQSPDSPVELGRVVRTEGDRIWIAAPNGNIELARKQVRGKVVYPEPPR